MLPRESFSLQSPDLWGARALARAGSVAVRHGVVGPRRWDLPALGVRCVCPALTGGFLIHRATREDLRLELFCSELVLIFIRERALKFKNCRIKNYPYSFVKLYPAYGQREMLAVVQSLSHVQLFATPWTAAHQAFLSFTVSRNLLKFMFTELVMPSHPLSPPSPASVFPSTRVFSTESALCIK